MYTIHHVALSVTDRTKSIEFYLPIVGTKHFGLKVSSIEAARDDLAAKGIVKSDIQITQGCTGIRYFFIEDPDGILVEIAEDKREFTI